MVNGSSCNDYVIFISNAIRDLLSQRAQRGITESEKGIINQQLNQEVAKIQSQLKIPLITDVADSNYFNNLDTACHVTQIITSLESGEISYPDWFKNNIAYVKSGQITAHKFLTVFESIDTANGVCPDKYCRITHIATGIISHEGMCACQTIETYQNSTAYQVELLDAPIVTPPIVTPPIVTPPIVTPPIVTPPQIDDSINTNMVSQQVINFNIVNGRAVGSIKFVATNNFNSYYYNKEIVNLVQFKTPNGVTLLVKENRLRFTETERDEIINYNESIQENTRITVESFVWEWMDKPAGAFSNKYTIDISEKEPPKPTQAGFMSAGIAGAIAGLVLIGFIADHKRGK